MMIDGMKKPELYKNPRTKKNTPVGKPASTMTKPAPKLEVLQSKKSEGKHGCFYCE